MLSKTAVSKFWLDVVWKMNGFERRAASPPNPNLFSLLKRAPELLILNRISFFKSFNDISSYYRVVLSMILLICPFENLHVYSFFRLIETPKRSL